MYLVRKHLGIDLRTQVLSVVDTTSYHSGLVRYQYEMVMRTSPTLMPYSSIVILVAFIFLPPCFR